MAPLKLACPLTFRLLMWRRFPPLTMVKVPKFKSCPPTLPRSKVPPFARYREPIVKGPVSPGVTIVPPATLIEPA